MAVDVVVEVEIARPRSEVAAFMFEPANDPVWSGGVVDVRPEQPGLLRTGSRVERVSKFLGRRFGYLIEVVADEPERFVEMRATRPFEMLVRYELESAGPERTVARIHASGGGSAFFRMAGPLLSRAVRGNIKGDLDRLRDHLEATPSRERTSA